ncbi:MAG TPA: hypothetical protein VHO46_04795 [Bacteroidales bacterium]|nr:hypothetical protein [Bacteroidales bacterium]
MRKLFFLLILTFLYGCREEAPDSYFTVEKATQYFNSIEEVCNIDNGNLWGENLYGPIMFIDRITRRITANFPDSEGLLKGKDGIYTGYYPKEMVIYTAPVNYGGTNFAMVPLPNEENEIRTKSRTIHVLYHCLQKRNGIEPILFNQTNMDDKEARLYLKLEWKALKKAISAEGNERLVAIRDALVFRGAGRELYQKYTTEGNHFETYEGLATFTELKLYFNTADQFKTKILEYLDYFYSMPSYTRSYGSMEGALYATLLCDSGYKIAGLKTDTIDLARLVREAYKIELPVICRDVAGSLAFSYDLDVISKEEEERLDAIKGRLHQLTSIFTEKAVVYIELESPYFAFEPEDIHPVDTLGTLYNAMRVSDSWGKLTVDKGGCLVSNNYRYLRITAKGFKADKNRISGEGWNIILNEGWELVEVKQNYFLRRSMPL